MADFMSLGSNLAWISRIQQVRQVRAKPIVPSSVQLDHNRQYCPLRLMQSCADRRAQCHPTKKSCIEAFRKDTNLSV
eukprot:3663189-Amphidinium_carterae.1